MTQLQHPIFGLIEIHPGQVTFWQGDVVVNGVSSRCSLFIGEEVADNPEVLRQGLAWLEDVSTLDRVARQVFQDHPRASGVVGDYIDFHRQELSDEAIQRVFDGLERSAITAETVLSKLALTGVGLHLDGLSGFTANLDYGFRPYSDQLLVARWHNNGQALEVMHES